jgi:hypothetical protein
MNMSIIWTEKKKIELLNICHFVENTTETMQHDLKMQSNLWLLKYINLIFGDVLLCVITSKNAGP